MTLLPPRAPWEVRVHTWNGTMFTLQSTWTPTAPGPLVGAFDLQYNEIDACTTATLNLNGDLDWEPATRLVEIYKNAVRVWLGTNDVTRGGRNFRGNAYTLSLVGLHTVDENAEALDFTVFPGFVNGSYTPYGVFLPNFKAGETWAARIQRAAPSTPVPWGVRADGTRVIGFANALPGGLVHTLTPADLTTFQPSGFERTDAVTDVIVSPGDRYAPLRVGRVRPTPMTPRRLASASADNLLTEGTLGIVPFASTTPSGIATTPATLSWTTPDLPSSGTGILHGMYQLSVYDPADPAVGIVQTARVHASIFLSPRIAASAANPNADSATYELTGLSFVMRAKLTAAEFGRPISPNPPPLGSGDGSGWTGGRTSEGRIGIVAKTWLSTSPDADDYEDALLKIERVTNLSLITVGKEVAWEFSVPTDVLSGAKHTTYNGGSYYYRAEFELTFYAAREDYMRRYASGEPQSPVIGSNVLFWGWGSASVETTLDPIRTKAKVVTGSIPTANLPPEYAEAFSLPRTVQGVAPGVRLGAVKLTGAGVPTGTQFAANKRLRWDANREQTEFQTASPQRRN